MKEGRKMKNEPYNGWENYETWVVNLWLSNDYALNETATDICRGKEIARAAADLKTWVEEITPDLGATLWADLLNGALSEVNWFEIADSFCEK
jgi:hypothetical protein